MSVSVSVYRVEYSRGYQDCWWYLSGAYKLDVQVAGQPGVVDMVVGLDEHDTVLVYVLASSESEAIQLADGRLDGCGYSLAAR